MFERPDLGSERPKLRAGRPDLGSDRPDWGSERPNLRPRQPCSRLGGDRRTDERTETRKFTLCGIIGHRPLRGRCPKKRVTPQVQVQVQDWVK